MVIQMNHHMDNHIDIHVVIMSGYVWIRLWLSKADNYGYLYGDPLGVNLDISTLDISLDIQFGYPRYPNSGNISVKVIRKSRICMDMFGYV
jgi:hypothetical protein